MQELLTHGARRVVRTRGIDRTWTPMTVATYYGLTKDVCDLLRPTAQDLREASAEDQEWAWGSDGGKRGISHYAAFCDQCLLVRPLALPAAHLLLQNTHRIQAMNRNTI